MAAVRVIDSTFKRTIDNKSISGIMLIKSEKSEGDMYDYKGHDNR